MKVIALIHDSRVIRRILDYLGRREPRQRQHAPAARNDAAQGLKQTVRELSYHPVPDIAWPAERRSRPGKMGTRKELALDLGQACV